MQSTHFVEICWGIVGLVWIIGALYNLYKAPTVVKVASNFRIIWIVTIVVVIAVTHIIPHKDWMLITYHATWLTVIGIFILLVSTLFTLWARWVLGKMWSSAVTVKSNHQLRTNGPYQVTRHPIYTGLLGMLLGTMLMAGFGPFLLYFIAAVTVIQIKIRKEEQFMMETFGDQYLEFKKRTPQLVPGLKWRR